MRKLPLAAALAALLLGSVAVAAPDKKDDKAKPETKPDAALLQPQSSSSEGSVSVEGHRIDYKAVAGTLVLHGSGDKENEPIAFCGHPRLPGSSYCAPHFHLTRGPGTEAERAAAPVVLRLVQAA